VQGTGNREQGTRDRQQGTGNREQTTGIGTEGTRDGGGRDWHTYRIGWEEAAPGANLRKRRIGRLALIVCNWFIFVYIRSIPRISGEIEKNKKIKKNAMVCGLRCRGFGHLGQSGQSVFGAQGA
jgi:hypothetical protein